MHILGDMLHHLVCMSFTDIGATALEFLYMIIALSTVPVDAVRLGAFIFYSDIKLRVIRLTLVIFF